MQHFQRNLFILIAVALCGTCAYQWSIQSRQVAVIERQTQELSHWMSDAQSSSNSLRLRDEQIGQLQDRIGTLKSNVMADDEQILEAKHELAELRSLSERLTNEVAQYHAAVDNLDKKLKDAYAGEQTLASQRNDLATKLNDSIKSRNTLTSNYNTLVLRFNQLQNSQPVK